MVDVPPLTEIHKLFIMDALISVVETQMLRNVVIDKAVIKMAQDCIKIVDNWKGDENYGKD